MSAPCTGALAFGSVRTVTRTPGSPGVRINMVAAQHDDRMFNPPLLLTEPLGTELNDNGLTVYDGLANGYVLTFTNGLKDLSDWRHRSDKRYGNNASGTAASTIVLLINEIS